MEQTIEDNIIVNPTLTYDDIIDTSKIENVLLINEEINELYKYSNSNTFGIVYNVRSSRKELLKLLRSKFTRIKRISIAFHYIDSEVFFLDIEKLFTTEDLDRNVTTYSKNLQFIIDIINEFKITNIDYLACNTLQNDNYKKYYNILTDKTNVLVGASDDKTGNINYGGDWVLESTQEDVQNIYFTNEIVNYANLLATTTYTLNNINYSYDPSGISIPSGKAKVGVSSSATGAVVILSTFTVNSVTYTVNTIGSGAFSNNANITTVFIPNTITSIEASGFSRCSLLNTVTFEPVSQVQSIANYAFDYSTSLKNIIIPDSVTTLGIQMFIGSGIASIVLPNNPSFISIPNSCFLNCIYLNNVNIPNYVTTIGTNSFQGCTSLSNIALGTNLTTISSYAFNICTALNNVSIPNTLTTLGNDAFYGCTSLSDIILPNNLTTINNNTFNGCTSLTSVTFPNNSFTLGTSVFRNCTALNNVTFPTTLTTIGNSNFQNCTSLSNIILPTLLTTLGNDVFNGCTSLSTITLPTSLTTLGTSVFKNCTSLNNVVIPNSLTTLNNELFSGCTSLSTITLPTTLTSLGLGGTFYGCTSLSTITLPNSITSVGSGSFLFCSSLTSIILTGGSNATYSTNGIDGILYNPSKTIIYIYPPGKPETNLSLIPNTVTTYNTYAFASNINLTTINIPSTVTSINTAAFYSCTSLTSVTFPNTLTTITTNTFQNCTSLLSIIIPSSVTSIGANAFYSCTSLKTLFIPKTVTSIGSSAFYGIPSNANPTPLNAATLYTGPFDFTDPVYTYFKATFTGSTQINYIEYPAPMVCFKEDSKILTKKGYLPIQDLRKGDLIKTIQNGYVAIDMIGYREIYNPICEERIQDKLYICTNKEYSEIFEDLVITGCHSILVDKFKNDKEKEETSNVLGANYVTDGKYRLPACVDERAKPYEKEGCFTIYHLALENDDYYMNYGIYANGLIVETCSKRYLKELSKMILINL